MTAKLVCAVIVAIVNLAATTALSANDFGLATVQLTPDVTQRLLAAQNYERQRLGLGLLRWDDKLSQQAQIFADTLVRGSPFEHSSDEETGENLWIGTAHFFSPEQMIGDFLSERRAFHKGRFPNVSDTGDWADVGHYTQVIWPETQTVGCALAQNQGEEVMVCRYWPEGNVEGESIG